MKNKVSFLFASIIILSGCSITIGEPAKDNNAKQEDKSENNDTNNENNKQSTPNIDILSQDFSDNYMNANHVTGYKGLIKNMNKKEVQQKYGEEDDIRNFLGREGYVYGNFMVMYYLGAGNPIEQYSIIPNQNVTYKEFVDFHGEPTQDLRKGQGHSFVIYNKTPNNGYQIAVYTEGSNEDDEIRYIMQYPDDFEFSNSSNDENTVITRDNVFDAVEAFEGIDKVDTDKTIWKEPEKKDDTFGFSYTDKNGKLLGSYNVREDGYVESFDEKGNKIRAGYINLND